jgi:hypothetical protein
LGGSALPSGPAANPEWLLGQHPGADGVKQFINANGNPTVAKNETADMNTDSPYLVAEWAKSFLHAVDMLDFIAPIRAIVCERPCCPPGYDVAFVVRRIV